MWPHRSLREGSKLQEAMECPLLTHPIVTAICSRPIKSTAPLYNRSGEKLGTVYDVMLEKTFGEASDATMSFGSSSASAIVTTRFHAAN